MYRTNQKEIIEIIKQKRKEGLSQTKVSDFLNGNKYLHLNKYGKLSKFNQTIISNIENSITKKNEEFERKIKDNKTPSNSPLFEDKKEIKEKYLKVNETKDKQFLALNLKLECDKLKSIEQYVNDIKEDVNKTEKEISDLNIRLEKLNECVSQYNKLMNLTKQQIEEINKELSNE